PFLARSACHPTSHPLPTKFNSHRFLVPTNMLVGEFKYIIHKHIKQSSCGTSAMTHEKTIYLFINGTALKAGALMQEIYEMHMAEDGFLYIEYAAENTLG
ncbi:putative autophagy protein 8i, partial [Gregarina niphandrodes]